MIKQAVSEDRRLNGKQNQIIREQIRNDILLPVYQPVADLPQRRRLKALVFHFAVPFPEEVDGGIDK